MTAERARDEHQSELEREYERRFSDRADYRWKVWTLLTRDFFQQVRAGGRRGPRARLRLGRVHQPDPRAAEVRHGSESREPRAAGPGIEFLHQDCSERWPLDDNTLDTVFTSNFFEHLPDKTSLGRTLREACRCLKPGGRIVCLGPNIRALPGAYWDFWDHYLPLTELSLSEGLELSGFKTETSIARFLPYTMARARNPPVWTVGLYIRLPLVWPMLGKQFLVVAVKP